MQHKTAVISYIKRREKKNDGRSSVNEIHLESRIFVQLKSSQGCCCPASKTDKQLLLHDFYFSMFIISVLSKRPVTARVLAEM